MIFNGASWHLDIADWGAPLVPPFAVVGGDCDPNSTVCPQPGYWGRTLGVQQGDELLPWNMVVEYQAERVEE
jgi:hypothetical protein